MTQTHFKALHRGSSFALSFLFMSRPKRAALQRVYAFCHLLDDLSDGPNSLVEKQSQMDFWRGELDAAYHEKAKHPVTQALGLSIAEFHLTRKHFEEMLQGIEMDFTINRYEDFAHLSQYCYRVAGTVGLICLEIFGCPKKDCQDYAVALGLAFQITNILRDVKEDQERGRIYLPLTDLRHFGYTESDLMAHAYNHRFVELMRFQADRAEDYFHRAADLLKPEYRKRLIAPEIMTAVYYALLRRIQSLQYNVFENRIRLSRPHKLTLALRAALANRLQLGRVTPA